MNLPVELLLTISLLGQQVSENLLSPFLSGRWMKLAAILMSVVLFFGAWVLDLNGAAVYTAVQVVVLGIFAGLGSNVVNGLLNRFAPTSKDAPLAGVLRDTPSTPHS